MKLHNLTNAFLDALFPPDVACFACNAEARLNAQGLCVACAAQTRWAGVLPPPAGMDGLYAAFLYGDVLHATVHRFKYGGAKYLAERFAACMTLPDNWDLTGCVFVPVPLSPAREKERGYNQAALLAQALSPNTGLPVAQSLLSRIKNTPPQAGQDKSVREKNMCGAFRASPQVAGRAFILVDDVVTTGSTLTACAEALRDAGASRVYAACFCAAP